MIVFFLHDVNPEGLTADGLLPIEDGWRVEKDGFNLIYLHGRHGHAAVAIFWKTGEHPRTAGQLSTHLIMRPGGAGTKPTEAIKLCKIRNTSFSLVSWDSTLVERPGLLRWGWQRAPVEPERESNKGWQHV